MDRDASRGCVVLLYADCVILMDTDPNRFLFIIVYIIKYRGDVDSFRPTACESVVNVRPSVVAAGVD